MLVNEARNVNETLISSKEDKRYNVSERNKARYLVEKFEKIGCNDASKCFNYFVKCFKNLSENTIWTIYDNASSNSSIKSPIKYFIAACRNQMAMK